MNKLLNAALAPEVNKALQHWGQIEDAYKEGVLIGGIAVSMYSRARSTEDIDILYREESDVPDNLTGFRKFRAHSFRHNQTHVEVETLTPDFLRIPKSIVNQVFDTAVQMGTLRVASVEGIIALKLVSTRHKDMSDVITLLQHNPNIDMSSWNLDMLTQDKLDKARELAEEEFKNQPRDLY